MAILLHAFHLTGGSVSVLAVNATLVLAPAVVAAPFAGVLARRHPPRLMMLISDLVRAGASVLLLASGSVWSLLLLQAAFSSAGVLYGPARQSMLPHLVDASRLHAANAAFATTSSMVLSIGPVLGSLLYAGGGIQVAAIADAGLYLAGAAMLLALRPPASPSAQAPPSFVHQMGEGFALVRHAADLRRLIILTLTAGASVGILVPLLRPFVEDVLHGGDRSYGLLMGAFGLGGMVGPAIALVAERRLGLGRTLLIGFTVEPVIMLVWARSPLLGLSIAVMFLWGVVVFALVTCQTTYVQRFASRELLSSAFAMLDQAGNAAQLVAALVVVVAAPVAAPQGLIAAAALAYLVVALLSWLSPGGRLILRRESAR
jgi:predicted MFS family arabinose efflux permease